MNRRIIGVGALSVTAVLTLGGCATGYDLAGGGAGSDAEQITLGYIPSWTDGVTMAYLLEDQLEKQGYAVQLQTLTEAGPLFAGVAEGSIDVYPSAWPKLTHAEFMNAYEGDLTDLGAYYEGGGSFIAVPSYTDIDSLEELAGNGALFDNEIIGIEPGAGLTALTKDTMLPTYGLEGEYSLKTSSTPAMLTVLEEAIANQEDVLVTFWKPFWANGAFDLKTLEDPRGGMGEAETMNIVANADFAAGVPELSEWISTVKFDDAQYSELEDLIVNEYGEGREAEAVDVWLEENAADLDWVVE